MIQDYSHIGLTLRPHPVSFLRQELAAKRIMSCYEANTFADRRKVTTAGLVLVCQRPGSAKGVMFITIEDESGTSNLVIWPSIYERQRRIILTANMIAVEGKAQREGLVVHIVADRLIDLADELARIGEQDTSVRLPSGRGELQGDIVPQIRANQNRRSRGTSISQICTSTRSS